MGSAVFFDPALEFIERILGTFGVRRQKSSYLADVLASKSRLVRKGHLTSEIEGLKYSIKSWAVFSICEMSVVLGLEPSTASNLLDNFAPTEESPWRDPKVANSETRSVSELGIA